MPDYKNQHFVPRCVLKPFTVRGDGKAINLYTFLQEKIVQNAPVKHQCARDYFYGDDGNIEHGLAKIERLYAASLERIQKKTDTDEDRRNLCFFVYLQLRRTEMAIHRLKASEQAFFLEIFGDQEPENPPKHYFMVQSLRLCFETFDRIEDLKVRIVENRTKTDFVISDDPAIQINRYAVQRLKDNSFGLESSGLILGMPITPRLAVICYDGLVYTAPNLENNRIVLTKSKDADALNELQYLKGAANIYFSAWESREGVRQAFERSRPQRNDEFVTFKHLIPVGNDERGEIYIEGSADRAKAAGRSIVQTTFHHPIPSCWLSELRFRNPVKTFSNGTMIGEVRKKEWLKSDHRNR